MCLGAENNVLSGDFRQNAAVVCVCVIILLCVTGRVHVRDPTRKNNTMRLNGYRQKLKNVRARI